jgi:glucose-6-phosphate 1-dehydrogenase
MPAKLTAVETQTADEVDAYERLLADAMHGDGMLFVREDALEAAWAIVEPILDSTNAIHSYEPGSWGPHDADRLTTDVGGWHNSESCQGRVFTGLVGFTGSWKARLHQSFARG